MSIRSFWSARNRVLFWTPLGGLGDVLMQRMLYDNVKRLMPDCEIHVACMQSYHEAVADHPAVCGLHPALGVDLSTFIAHYKTCVTPANAYENHYGIGCRLNRSDIWGLFCGFELQTHDMNIRLDRQTLASCRRRLLELCRDPSLPVTLLAPVSAVRTKSLLPEQLRAVVEASSGTNLVYTHKCEVPELESLGVRGVHGTGLREWMHTVAAADYVVSVDTAAFHLAGGLGKPLVGVFTFANGKTYGRYYDFVLVQRHVDDGDWDCGPCYNYKACSKTSGEIKPCLSEIPAKTIRDAIAKMYEKWPSGSPDRVSYGNL